MKASLAVVFLFLATGTTLAQTSDCASLTHQALELSGVNRSMGNAAEFVGSDAFLAPFSGPDGKTTEFTSGLKAIVANHLNGDLLRKELEARMTAHCNAEQIARTLQELQTPLVARMLVLEAAASTPEGREKREKYARVMSIAPPSDDRLDAIADLDASSGVTEFNVSSIIVIMRGMTEGAEINSDWANGLDPYRRELTQMLRKPVQIDMLSEYRAASLPDLQQYSKELKSEPLKSFYDDIEKTLLEIVEKQARLIGRDMKVSLNARLASRGRNP
jgi:hypothetical protein